MKRSKAFTLIELLVVVAIIALLIAILLPSLGRAREMAKRSVCAANLKGVGTAIAIYGASYRGNYPQATKARIRNSLPPGTPPLQPVEKPQDDTVFMFDTLGAVGMGKTATKTPMHRWQEVLARGTETTTKLVVGDTATPQTWSKDTSMALPSRDIFLLVRQNIAQAGQFSCPSTGNEKDTLQADKVAHDSQQIRTALGVNIITDVLASGQLWDFLEPDNLDYGFMQSHR